MWPAGLQHIFSDVWRWVLNERGEALEICVSSCLWISLRRGQCSEQASYDPSAHRPFTVKMGSNPGKGAAQIEGVGVPGLGQRGGAGACCSSYLESIPDCWSSPWCCEHWLQRRQAASSGLCAAEEGARTSPPSAAHQAGFPRGREVLWRGDGSKGCWQGHSRPREPLKALPGL